MNEAASSITGMIGHRFNLIDICVPASNEAAHNTTKVISKLSPILGNMIEFDIVDKLNQGDARWVRQDPGFPDALLSGESETAGFEMKAWFPLATEITARFKNSESLLNENIDVCLLAWLPEGIISGKAVLIDAEVISATEVARARDRHYHKPPRYLVIEPKDTSARAVNLQQTNASGYVFQGSPEELARATKYAQDWKGPVSALAQELMVRFPYRQDTNFAKLDRIGHEGVQRFKDRVFARVFNGRTVREWSRLLGRPEELIAALG